MGAIAESIMSYAQPLLDQTDGSIGGMNRAMAVAQTCWNLALLPEDRRDAAIDEIKAALDMADGEFAEFRQQVVLPMIRRHHEMFPGMHARSKQISNTAGVAPSPTKQHSKADRYAACPCGSGRKYKFCCGSQK